MLYIVCVLLLLVAFLLVASGVLHREFSVTLFGLIPALLVLGCAFWIDAIVVNNRYIDAVEVARYDHLKEIGNTEENTLENDYIFSTATAPNQYLFYYYPTEDSDTYERYTFSSSKVRIIETEDQLPMVIVYELYQRCDLNILERILVFGETSKFKGMKYEIYLPQNAVEIEH